MSIHRAVLSLALPAFAASLLATPSIAIDARSPAGSSSLQDPAAESTPSVIASKGSFRRELERPGRFVPDGGASIEIWPQAYSGELLVMEVVPHGSPVNEGQVIARLRTRPIDEMIHQAELDLHTAEIAHQSALARAELDTVAADRALERARAALGRAMRRLEGWENYELAFRARSAELSEMAARAGIEDQEDELGQLEKMYREDELTDATEEIVLKRARRSLARSRASLAYQIDRRQYEVSLNEPLQSETLKEAAEDQRLSLQRLEQTTGLDDRTRQDGLVRSEETVRQKAERLQRLRHDRESFILRAPRRGILLHGGADDYGPGKVPPRFRKGSTLRTRSALFTVVDPGRVAVSLSIPESRVGETRPHMAARLRPSIDPTREILGSLEVERTPDPASAAAGENTYVARVRLEEKLPGIFPGMRATVALVLQDLHDVIVLPRRAISGTGPDAHCTVARAGRNTFERVGVRLGPANDHEVVVLEGVDEGDRVLLAGEKSR